MIDTYEIAARFSAVEYGAPVGSIQLRDAPATRTVRVEQRNAARPALRGLATCYMKCHAHRGGIEVFTRGAFASAVTGKHVVRFLLDHKNERLIATTADRLELADCDAGLAFRVEIPDTPEGREARASVEKFNRAHMSVGYEAIDFEWKDIDGTRVKLIRSARLDEISLVASPAVRETFASLVSDRKTLAQAISDGDLASDRMMHALRALKKRFE